MHPPNLKKVILFFLLLISLGVKEASPAVGAPIIALEVIGTKKHDPTTYTQGLFFHQGHLYESQGLYGKSAVTRWDLSPATQPKLLGRWEFDPKYFGEGAALVEGDLYVLTWREEMGYILDAATLQPKGSFSYRGEGWGLAWDGEKLWRSDGSNLLYPHHQGDFSKAGTPVVVTDEGRPVSRLNELEWDPLTSLMLANIYGSDKIAAIDLKSGQVIFYLDGYPLRALAEAQGLPEISNNFDTVLNGLALSQGRLWLTGKLWPILVETVWPPKGIPIA